MGAEKWGFSRIGFDQEIMEITEEMAESWRQNHGGMAKRGRENALKKR